MEYNIIILQHHNKSFYDIDIAEIGTGIGYTIRFSKELGFIKISDDSENNLIKLMKIYGNHLTKQYIVLYSFIYDTTRVTKGTFYKISGLKKISLSMAKIITHLLSWLYRKKDLKIAMDKLDEYCTEQNNLGNI